jgi:prepilin-type N-terminal cleavage/methylation domain-containing protein
LVAGSSRGVITSQERAMTSSARKRAFTLVELLVVIGIIALLVSILMPTLAKVRQSAIRTQCMSNQRQLLLGLEMYKSAYGGKTPIYVPGANMAGSLIIRHGEGDVKNWEMPTTSAFPSGRRGSTNEGYTNLGFLWLKRFVRDGRVFFCPINTYYNFENQWPAKNVFPDTGYNRVYSGYVYRIGGIGSVNSISAYPADRDDEIKFVDHAIRGQFRGVKSVTMDFFGYNPYVPANWPHLAPYGICVGWTDGHVSYAAMDRKDWYIIAGYTQLNDADKHMIMLFRWAFDQDDLRKVRTALGIR